MKKLILAISIAAFCGVAVFAQGGGTAAPAPPPMKFKVGDTAPDFTLTDTAGKEVKLSDFRGKKNVVLAFYVLAFTGG